MDDSSNSIADGPAPSGPTRLPLFPPSGSSVMPIRPEARRAYQPDDQGSSGNNERGGLLPGRSSDTTTDKNTLLLQQAAAYASLAIQQQQHQHQPRMRVDSGTESKYTSSVLSPSLPSPVATIAPLGAAVRRIGRGPFRTLSKRKKDAPLMSLHSSKTSSQRSQGGDGEDAPRLSISSADSSEIKTPDSASFIDVQVDSGESRKDKEKSTDSILGNASLLLHHDQDQSTAPIAISPAVDYSAHIRDNASVTRQRLVAQRLMEAYQEESREVEEANEKGTGTDTIDTNDQSATSSALTAQSRASTIRAKRPAGLLRLASARTDDTARPSPPSTSPVPSTAGPTPAATVNTRNPMEDAVVTMNDPDLLSSSNKNGSDNLAEQISQAFNEGMHTSSTYNDDDDLSQEPSISRDSIASPDSWRSLLPEHDPYFISSEALSSSTSSRAASFAGPINAQHRLSFQGHASAGGLASDNQVMAASPSDREGRRMSSESLQSSFSLAGPTAASIYASSNASSSLYDMDGTFNTGGSRAAFAPLQYHYNQSSKSLTSPLLQHAKAYDPYRSNSIDETREVKADSMAGYDGAAAQQAAFRRHASFSAHDSPSNKVDTGTGNGKVINPASPTTYASFIHPDHHDRSRVYGGRLQNSGQAAAASSPERQAVNAMPLKYSSLSSVISPSSPASSSAMGNEGDRQSWPSSRNSLQGWQSDVANKVSPRSFVQVLDPYSVNKKLAEESQSTTLTSDIGTLETIPSILSMSTSTTESDVPGLPADHRLLTTTTLTTLASTTTTLIASPMTPSETGSGSIHSAAQSAAASHPTPMMEQHTPQKPAYDVSSLSPASLPFLDSRPAPPSTELNVETHATHYTLKTKLPGFGIDGITLSTKHHRQLIIVADSWDEINGGHFERRVTFGTDADLRATKAIFDGTLLKITVPRVI